MGKRGHYTEKLKPGQKFGRLTVIEEAPKPSPYLEYRGRWYLCRCDCGNQAVVREDALKRGQTKSCGCLRREKARLTKQGGKKTMPVNPGQKYGRLSVIRETDQRKRGAVLWECRCDCGNTVYVGTHSLKSGNTKSCGCLQIERAMEYHRKRKAGNERVD